MTNLFSQSTCQRISAMKSQKDVRMSMIMNIPLNLVYGFLCTIVGWCMYAYFSHIQCDPFKAGIVNNPNQMTPFFVLHVMHDLPGFSGIYMSCLFSGALSTLSSGISALAANTVEDLLERPMKSFTEKTATTIVKAAVFLYGAAIIVIVYLARNLKGQVTQMGVSVFSTFGSSVVGIFLLGCTIPWGNKYGAIAGAIVSLVVNVWLVIGSALYGRKPTPLDPVPTTGCYEYNSTGIEHNLTLYDNVSYITSHITPPSIYKTPMGPIDVLPDAFSPYDISYEWNSVIGVALCFTVSVIVSALTKNWVHDIPEPKFILPCIRKFWGLQVPEVTVLHETNGLAKGDEKNTSEF